MGGKQKGEFREDFSHCRAPLYLRSCCHALLLQLREATVSSHMQSQSDEFALHAL